MTEVLPKPCPAPWCETVAAPRLVSGDGLHVVACPDCGLEGNAFATADEAIAEWNDRRLERQAEARALERAAQVCEQQQQDFLSEQYAVGQPLSSFQERFACGQCAAAIRALGESHE